MNQNFVVDVLIGKCRFDQFTQGVGRANSPGGLLLLCEHDAVPLPFGEGGEFGLEIRVTLQRQVEVMTQLKGRKKDPVVLQLSGDVINRLAVNRGQQSQTHGRGGEISGHC